VSRLWEDVKVTAAIVGIALGFIGVVVYWLVSVAMPVVVVLAVLRYLGWI